VVDNGLSVIDPKKLQFTIDSIADAYKLPSEPNSSTVYTDKFLPPLAERKL
jgi:NitT/TauT family transport system substrate-binding protein